MRILFVHQNYPGQYRYLAPALAARGHEVKALGIEENPYAKHQPGVDVLRYRLEIDEAAKRRAANIHPLLQDTQSKIARGEGTAIAAQALKKRGFVPDLICVHPGWGEAIFLKDVWPHARMLCYLEFYYGTQGADLGFDPEFETGDPLRPLRTRTKNIFHLLSAEAMNWGVTPTNWQKSRFPKVWQPYITQIHEGVLTNRIAPDPAAELRLPNGGPTLRVGDEVITYAARNMEPYRGFHRFMRALPAIMAARPKAQVVIVGADKVSYGRKPSQGGSWQDAMLAELAGKLDLSRIHFTGMLPYGDLTRLFQITRAHVYFTYPFVLSWSMLEAMSAGALVIGSRTAPVEEMIQHEHNGLLVDFFDQDALVDTVVHALEKPDHSVAMRQAARQTIVERYDLERVCLPQQIELAERVGRGELTQPF